MITQPYLDWFNFQSWLIQHEAAWLINLHRMDLTDCMDHTMRFARERNFGAERTNRLVDSVLAHRAKNGKS